MGFQTQFNIQQAPYKPGDLYGGNPYFTVPTPEAGFIAGSTGIIVARFVWVDPSDTTGRSLLNSGTGKPLGFVINSMEGTITTYLAESGMTILPGKMVTVLGGTDFVVLVTVNPATQGQKAFAKLSDGTMQPGTAGATISGYIETDFTISVGAAVGEYAVMSGSR